MFERIYMTVYIYDGVVEPSYKQYSESDATRASHISKKRGEAASSHNYSAMSYRSGKLRKRYLDYPMGLSHTWPQAVII